MFPEATPILGRMLLVLGILLALTGLLLLWGPRLPGFLGHLPGDLSFGRGNVRFHVPLGTCILLSLVLTLLFALVSWLRR